MEYKTHQKPIVVKHVQQDRTGIHANTLHRESISYIKSGSLYIYQGDSRTELTKGSVYYLGSGSHYIEYIPEENKPYECITFYFDFPMLNQTLNYLSINLSTEIANDHKCPNCEQTRQVSCASWPVLTHFYTCVDNYISEDVFTHNENAAKIKFGELIYLAVTQEDSCLKRCLLNNVDADLATFDQIVRENIFNDLTIEELAEKCKKSLTAFKKEFKKQYNESPHKWCIRQRLQYAQLLLSSTNKSVADIGRECNFPNTSHFIKLFKKEYETTPMAYRNSHERIHIEG